MIWHDSDQLPTESGKYVAPHIKQDWLLDAYQIHHKDGCIHTIRCADPACTITLPQRLHLDCEGPDTIEANQELFTVLQSTFPWIDKPYRVGGYSSLFAGVVAKKCRPFFDRRYEIEALKGMYGGRSEILGARTGRCDLVEYDIPSSYPSACLDLIPVGTPVRVIETARLERNTLDMVQVSGVIQDDIGLLPLRHKHGIYFPKECRLDRQWYWQHELHAALRYAETVRDFTIHQRLRFRAAPELRGIMEKLITLRHKHKEHQKTIKMIANRIVGMFAYTGSKTIVFYPEHSQDIKAGDWLLDPEIDLWGRKIKTKGYPHTYQPFIASYVWSKARVDLLHAIMDTEHPVSCHVDCVLAGRQTFDPRGTRIKEEYGVVNYEIPWRGALYIEGRREKAPGLKR